MPLAQFTRLGGFTPGCCFDANAATISADDRRVSLCDYLQQLMAVDVQLVRCVPLVASSSRSDVGLRNALTKHQTQISDPVMTQIRHMYCRRIHSNIMIYKVLCTPCCYQCTYLEVS
jgi:hypothetical protein